jgi:putative protease
MEKNWQRELSMFSSRGYTTGMFFGKQPDTGYNHDDNNIYKMSHELIGVVKSVINGKVEVALRNKLKVGDIIEFLSADLENKPFNITEIYNREGVPVAMGKNEETVLLPAYHGVKENDLIRRPLNHSSY